MHDGSGAAPTARSSTTFQMDSSETIWMFGGWRTGRRVFQDLWSFDTQTLTWTQHADGPTYLQMHTVNWGGNALLYMGGTTTPEPDGYSGDLWKYFPSNDTWTKRPNGPPGFGHATAFDPLGKVMLLVGGTMDHYTLFNDVWSYTLQTDTWIEEETSLSSSIAGFQGLLTLKAVWDPLGQRMLVHGGMSVFDLTSVSAQLWSYQISTNTTFTTTVGVAGWSLVSSRGPARRCHVIAYDAVVSTLWLWSGDDAGSQYKCFGDTWSFTAGSWVEESITGPPGRQFPASTWDSARRQWWIYGGQCGLTRWGDVWRFDAPLKSWTQMHDGVPNAGERQFF
eukprot:Skav222065  [mRNA]  locus=scaffold707:291120:292127:- [translate_table: standard]